MTVLGVILISVSLERGVSNAAPDYNMFWIFAVVIMGLAAAIPLIV